MPDGPPPRDLVKRMQEMRRHIVLVQAELVDMEVRGTAGDGLVTVVMRGNGEVIGVTFDQAAVDEGDAEALAALTLTALRHAIDALRSRTAERMAALDADIVRMMGTPRPAAR